MGLAAWAASAVAAEAAAAIDSGLLDAVAFGTAFLANPDLPARIKAGAPLNVPDPASFYTPGAPRSVQLNLKTRF